jgi:hypothetical protein
LAVAAQDEIAGVTVQDFGLLGAGDEIEHLFGPFGGFGYYLSGVRAHACGVLDEFTIFEAEMAECGSIIFL